MKNPAQEIDWKREYEDLRQGAMRADAHLGHGLALFLSRGMMAWLDALTALKTKAVMSSTTSPSVTPPDVPSAVRTDMTTLLASMVLGCIKGEGHECTQ